MALVSCPECQNKISNEAEACPHCGFPYRETERLKKERAAKKAANRREERKLLRLTVKHAKGWKIDMQAWGDLDERILKLKQEIFDKQSILLEWDDEYTEAEMGIFENQKKEMEAYFGSVADWVSSLPRNLRPYGNKVCDAINRGYQLVRDWPGDVDILDYYYISHPYGSFESLVSHVLLEKRLD
jgi:hypothetical protein